MAKNGFKLLDSDMHIIEPPDLWEIYIDPAFRDKAPRGWAGVQYPSVIELEGKVMPRYAVHSQEHYHSLYAEKMAQGYSFGAERDFDPVSQLRAMDAEGIDKAVLFPTKGLYTLAMNELEPRFAAAISRAYNDWLADFCKEDPSRLYGAAMVPPHHAPSAAAEVRRMAQEHSFKAIFMRPNPVHGRDWHDPYYDPLWNECQSLDIAVCFHEGGSVYLPQLGNRFSKISMQHALCHPLNMMEALVDFVMGGILERFPRLRVAFLEANCSWVPFLLWRLDEHIEWQGKRDLPYLTMSPSDYFRRQCFVATECDEEPAKYTIDWIGENTILSSTDYPHSDSKYPHASETLLGLPLSESSKRKIMWDNCARLYDLG